MIQFLALLFFPLLMIWAAVSDLMTMTISNRISIALLGFYLLMALLTGQTWPTIGYHLGCGLVVLAITFAMFAFGWIGGGDAKLAAATAVWFGFSGVMAYAMVAAIFGGVLTLVLLNARRFPLPNILARYPWIARLHHPETGVLYGIALAAAGLFMYPESRIWLAAVAA
ncbi:MAG: prepilin peptidase [Beijerinckiaceae bacterium]